MGIMAKRQTCHIWVDADNEPITMNWGDFKTSLQSQLQTVYGSMQDVVLHVYKNQPISSDSTYSLSISGGVFILCSTKKESVDRILSMDALVQTGLDLAGGHVSHHCIVSRDADYGMLVARMKKFRGAVASINLCMTAGEPFKKELPTN